MPFSSSLLTGPAPEASPRLLGQVDEEHLPARIVVGEAVHVGVLNLHETTHLALLPCFGVEDHLENIRFSCSTLKEVPMAVQTQTQMVAAYGAYKLLTEVFL